MKLYKKAVCGIVVSVFTLALNNPNIIRSHGEENLFYSPGVYSAAGETGNHIRDGVWGTKLDVIPEGTWFNVTEIVDGVWGYVPDGVSTYEGYFSGYVYLPYCSYISQSSDTSGDTQCSSPELAEPAPETYTEPPISDYYITSEYGAWLRGTPDFSEDNKLGILSTGQYIKVTKIDGDWLYVSDTNVENDYSIYSGWVYNGCAGSQSSYDHNDPVGAMHFDQSSQVYYNYHVKSEIGAWLRDRPDGNQLITMNTGDPVYVYEIADSWAHVSYNGTEGWIHQSLIAPDNAEITNNRVFDYNNEALIYGFLVNQLSMTDQAASGILANIRFESNFDPNAYCIDTNGLPSYGICQWNGPRYNNLMTYCQNNGYDYTTLDGQLAFMEYEFSTSFNSQFNQLKNITDTFEASYYFASSYEFCSSDQWSVRSSYAVEKYC